MHRTVTGVALILFVCGVGYAQGRGCTDSDSKQAETEADTLRTWDSLYKSYSLYRNCDDGAIAEGYSESVARILVDHWNTLPGLADLARKNEQFFRFVLRHVDATDDDNDLRKIRAKAATQCPAGLTGICHDLKKAGDSALDASGARVPATKPTPEQNIFSEDDQRFDHSIALPSGVLKVLLETEEAKEGLASANDSDRKNVAQLFRAVEVHLAAPQEVDLIVLGVPPMSGADNTWFWLVASAYVNPRIVLFSGGNSLELMTARTNGYRDIRSVWSSPSETNVRVFHYQGRKYTIWKDKWTENGR